MKKTHKSVFFMSMIDNIIPVSIALEKTQTLGYTGKSVSEALILESVNPQYDERLFIESPEKY